MTSAFRISSAFRLHEMWFARRRSSARLPTGEDRKDLSMLWAAAAWLLLYWLAMGAVIFLANRMGMKYPTGSGYRKGADVILVCAIVLTPVAPLIVLAAWLLKS
jgi:hypothetical protein